MGNQATQSVNILQQSLLASKLVARKDECVQSVLGSSVQRFFGGAPLVLLLRLSRVCRKERWAWSSSREEQPSSSSSMMPHCMQRRRGSRCSALQTQAVASDWGNSSITNGSRWAGSVSMLVAMVNGGQRALDGRSVEQIDGRGEDLG